MFENTAQIEEPTIGIANLVDPDREIGVPEDEYSPFALPLDPGKHEVTIAGVKRQGVTAAGDVYSVLVFQLEDGKKVEGFLSTQRNKWKPNTTSADDLLHAVGYQPYPKTVRQYTEALASAQGNLTIETEWEAVCFNHKDNPEDARKARVRKMENFPINEKGERKAVVPCPVCGEALTARTLFVRVVPKQK